VVGVVKKCGTKLEEEDDAMQWKQKK